MRPHVLVALALSMFFPQFAPAAPTAPAAVLQPNAVLANPLAMTITQTLAVPKKDSARRGKLTILADRNKTFLFEKDADLRFTYQLQADKTAPLVFVIPGTGGLSSSPGALFLAELLYRIGYQTVTVDDTFSWKFTVAASTSGLPGYMPRDTQDLYKALRLINAKLIADSQIRPRAYSMIGYSLGALQALFVHRLDDSAKQFQFSRLLLVDPPMDLMNAVRSLDNLYNLGDRLSPSRKSYVFGRVIEVGGKYLSQDANLNDPGFLLQAFGELNFTNRDLAYLIGGSFRDSLRDVIFSSQQVKDLKILKSPVTRYQRNLRYNESRQFSFEQYMSLFLYPQIKKQKGSDYNLEDMNGDSSFYQFGSYIQAHKNIFLVHTADDFILKTGDIAWIQDNFGSRAVIFPFGGHCGAMNFPAFTELLKTVF